MKDKLKYIFYSIIILGAFLLGTQTCKNSPKSDFKTVTDTLIVHKTDTIRDTTTIFKIKDRPVLTYTTIITKDSTKLNIYDNSYRDTNVVFYVKDTINGKLISRNVSYKLLKPLKIVDSVKAYITTTKFDTIIKLPKYQLKAGIMANNKSFYGTVDLSINKITYLGGYDPFNKQAIIGLKYTIYSK